MTEKQLISRIPKIVRNFEKSVLTPTQTIEYLGFTLHSPTMTLTIPHKKQASITQKVEEILNVQICTIRKFSQVLGALAATEPGNSKAKVLTKKLMIAKTEALQTTGGN